MTEEQNKSSSAFSRASINVKLNGNESDISAMSITIMEFDSIYQFYPRVKLGVSDYAGFCNEYLAFVDGTQVEITFGITDETSRKCTFVVNKNAVPQQKTSSNGTGGDFEIELVHEYYNNQFKISNAYNSNISDIVDDIVEGYKFNSVNIETTLNSGYWYQPYVTDSDFIVNYLLPFAYSSTSSNTPYFAFIDSNNNFNFRSLNNMFSTTPLKELTYGTTSEAVTIDDSVLSSVSFSQVEYNKIRPCLNIQYHNYDSNANFVTDNDSLLDYIKTQGKYPIIGNIENLTNIVELYDYDVDNDDTENNNEGYKINIHKESMLPDKIIINTVLNKDLTCGNMLQINLPMVNSNSTTENSLRNTGKYLIESSYHIWNGKTARTMLVCSKQNIKVTNDYRNKELLL